MRLGTLVRLGDDAVGPSGRRDPCATTIVWPPCRACQGLEFRLADLSEWESGKCSPLLEPGRWAADPATVARPRSRSQVQRHLSPEGQLEVVQMYQAGKTINAVARQFKLHRTTVTAILDRHDVPVRAHYMTARQVDEAQTLYESGNSLAEIGRRLGFDPATISNRLTGRGIHRRGQLSARESS
ncbi:helix-turn-helix domain-containing protein [Demequina maris]|uniref:helix-turn-helix domain-containing protein n=1 Tax=Demequina maris TaxID=1638982 RepID=UPI0009E24602